MNNIAIVGDIHFGKKGNDEKYLEFQLNWFNNELIPSIKSQNIKTLVFLGDIYDNRTSVNIIVLNKSREIFEKLTKLCTVKIIVGNHDSYYKDTIKFNSLDVLRDKGVIIYDKLKEETIHGKSVLFLPWIVPDELPLLETKLAHNKYDIVFGHLEINGFKKNQGLLEDTGLSQGLFGNCEKVYSGHFHLRDCQGKINYIGTPYELDWGDFGEDKGFVVFDMDSMTETYIKSLNIPRHVKYRSKDIPIKDIKRDMINNNFIDFLFEEDMSETDKIDYMEKIESYKPITFIHTDEKNHDMSVEDEEVLKSNIKDVVGSLVEYIKLVEVPEGLNLNVAIDKMKEVHDKII